MNLLNDFICGRIMIDARDVSADSSYVTLLDQYFKEKGLKNTYNARDNYSKYALSEGYPLLFFRPNNGLDAYRASSIDWAKTKYQVIRIEEIISLIPKDSKIEISENDIMEIFN